MSFHLLLTLTLAFFLLTPPLQTVELPKRTLSVGPGKELRLPSQAAAVARDGDVVEIDAGTYVADVAVWTANNLTLRGVGGKAHLRAGGANAEGKAIWVVRGNNATVENIEFSEAKVPDANGAGIRHEGLGLIVRHCYFHDNEMGILTSNNPANEVLVEYSELANSRGGVSHNIYVGTIRKFTLQFSYVHHAVTGHNVKSRAQSNYILYNRIMDESTGTSSYAVDIPNGGRSFLIGNIIHKGRQSENSSVIAYAAEGAIHPLQEFYLINNTVVSELGRGSFLQFSGTAPRIEIVNNVFSGRGVLFSSKGKTQNNLVLVNPGFQNAAAFDYRLSPDSPAIDAGIAPEEAAGFNLTPAFHYLHPLSRERRAPVGPLDIGAYEFTRPN